MATLRDLIALGFDPDTEVLIQLDTDDDHAWLTDMEVRHADEPGDRTVLVLSSRDAFVTLADLNEDELPFKVDSRDVSVFSEPFLEEDDDGNIHEV
jgi:hypothetical protein